MKIIIFDTETTGLLKADSVPIKQQPEIIEIGGIYLNDKLKIVKKLSQLIKPKCDTLPEIITKITGIKDIDLVDQPTFYEFLPILIKFFKNADMLIAHNAPFDQGMVKNELIRAECENFPWPQQIVCTIQEYKPRFGKWMKQEDLYSNILKKKPNQKHRALDDCVDLLEILKADNFFDQI